MLRVKSSFVVIAFILIFVIEGENHTITCRRKEVVGRVVEFFKGL